MHSLRIAWLRKSTRTKTTYRQVVHRKGGGGVFVSFVFSISIFFSFFLQTSLSYANALVVKEEVSLPPIPPLALAEGVFLKKSTDLMHCLLASTRGVVGCEAMARLTFVEVAAIDHVLHCRKKNMCKVRCTLVVVFFFQRTVLYCIYFFVGFFFHEQTVTCDILRDYLDHDLRDGCLLCAQVQKAQALCGACRGFGDDVPMPMAAPASAVPIARHRYDALRMPMTQKALEKNLQKVKDFY